MKKILLTSILIITCNPVVAITSHGLKEIKDFNKSVDNFIISFFDSLTDFVSQIINISINLFIMMVFISIIYEIVKTLFKSHKKNIEEKTALDKEAKADFYRDYPAFEKVEHAINELLVYFEKNQPNKLAVKKIKKLEANKNNILDNVLHIYTLNKINSDGFTGSKNKSGDDIYRLSMQKLNDIKNALNEFKNIEFLKAVNNIKNVDTLILNKQTQALIAYSKTKECLNKIIQANTEQTNANIISDESSYRIKALYEKDLDELFIRYNNAVGKEKSVHANFMIAIDDINDFLDDFSQGKNNNNALFKFNAQIKYFKSIV